MSIAIFGVSVPVIVMGPILVAVFAVGLGWFPPTGWGAEPPFTLFFLPSEYRPGVLPQRRCCRWLPWAWGAWPSSPG